jgi:hypothetical protein
MHYVTRISHQIQKHKFGITCPSSLFVESVPVPPKHEKLRINVLHSGHNKMPYVTCRTHRMQKHKLALTCPVTAFVESVPVPREHEK